MVEVSSWFIMLNNNKKKMNNEEESFNLKLFWWKNLTDVSISQGRQKQDSLSLHISEFHGLGRDTVAPYVHTQ